MGLITVIKLSVCVSVCAKEITATRSKQAALPECLEYCRHDGKLIRGTLDIAKLSYCLYLTSGLGYFMLDKCFDLG